MEKLSLVIFCVSLSGCGLVVSPFDDPFGWTAGKQKEAKLEMMEQQAAIMKLYRVCLEKYQNEPSQAKAQCEHYTQSLYAVDVRGMK